MIAHLTSSYNFKLIKRAKIKMLKNINIFFYLLLSPIFLILLFRYSPAIADSLLSQKQNINLNEVVVTATRSDKSYYDVPAAIGVVDEYDIGFGKQKLGLDEALVKLPGLFMQNRYNFAQSLKISIRGFGARANFGTRGVKLYQDGIPMTTVDGQGALEDIDLNSINRIEVIRGPASSLYGSSSGGVINFFTGDEGSVDPYVEGNFSIGQYQSYINSIKTGGHVKKLNYFLNLSHLDFEGYRQHNGVRNTKFNSKFKYKINDSSEFTTIFTAYDAPQADDPGGINQASVDADRRQARSNNVDLNSGEDIDQQKLGFIYRNQITENQELILRHYYLMRNFVGLIPVAADGWVQFERFQLGGGAQYSIFNNLLGHDNQMIIGFEIDSQEDDRQRYQNNNGSQGSQQLNELQNGDSLGFYFRDEISLSEELELSLGVRYDEVTLGVDDVFLSDGDQTSELKFEELSPMFGLSWKINPKVNIYGNISSVFETPTFTELTGVAAGGFANVSAQKALNYEVGIKGNISSRANYDFAVYRIDVEDEIINTSNINGRTFFNNADTTRNGVETTISFVPFTGTNMLMSYTYNDFTFDNFPASVCTTCAGDDLPGLPTHNFYTELSYTHPSGFFSSIDFQFVSNMYLDNDNTAQNRPYGVSNLRGGYIKTIGDMEITPHIGINNLFDKKYIGNVRINAFGSRFFEPAPELNIYAGITIRFN
jgi:iron complex outermembrane receptor protein